MRRMVTDNLFVKGGNQTSAPTARANAAGAASVGSAISPAIVRAWVTALEVCSAKTGGSVRSPADAHGKADRPQARRTYPQNMTPRIAHCQSRAQSLPG
jgi:hypothetical protein